jgi:hypothetical protein
MDFNDKSHKMFEDLTMLSSNSSEASHWEWEMLCTPIPGGLVKSDATQVNLIGLGVCVASHEMSIKSTPCMQGHYGIWSSSKNDRSIILNLQIHFLYILSYT